MNMSEDRPFKGGEDADHIDADKQLKDGEPINSDEDVHEAEAGNTGEIEAQKNKLDGPAIDLVGQPSAKDEDK